MSNNPFIFVLMEDKVYKGYISRFYSTQKYGFIHRDDEEYYFSFGKEEQKKLRERGLGTHFCSFGDIVQFKLKPSQQFSDKLEAYDLIFLGNDLRERLLEISEDNPIIEGYLKQIGDDYFVKELETYLFIPIKMIYGEINFQEVYTKNLNQLVQFSLNEVKRIDKITAYLVNRQIDEKYQFIYKLKETKELIEVTVTGKNAAGFFATYNNIFDCFILGKKVDHLNLKKGDTFKATVLSVEELVKLDLGE